MEEENKSTRLAKNKSGYGYKYTELAEINKYCEENAIKYYQEVETCETNQKDYIVTYISNDGKSYEKHRGCQIVDAVLSEIKNPVQEYGSSLTYCRRYSLLMALGLATEDDDAQSLTEKKQEAKATPKQLEMLLTKYTDENLVKLLQTNKIDKIEDLSMSKASELISKIYRR